VRDKRWIACLHGAFYYLPQSTFDETDCDSDMLAVSPKVADGCLTIQSSPWSPESFALVDWSEAM